MNSGAIKLSDISSSMRFDGGFHLLKGNVFYRLIKTKKHKNLLDYSKDIFTAGRSKRIHTTKKFGIPYLSNSDIASQNPFLGCKYVSSKFSSDTKSLLQRGMVLTGRVGAIGHTSIVTKFYEEFRSLGSDNVIRIVTKDMSDSYFLYAFMSSSVGKALIERLASGGVQPYINEEMLGSIPVPEFGEQKKNEIINLISEACNLRDEANNLLKKSEEQLLQELNFKDLSEDDYEHFGTSSFKRKLSCFTIKNNSSLIVSLNAFNHSEKLRKMTSYVKKNSNWVPLINLLSEEGFFSTGAFPRLEIDSLKSIKLINQSDIFNIKIEGKNISRRNVRTDNLVQYGEILIAGVGTLGENETFCRTIFANEELEGQLVSGEFIRMKTNPKCPSGYLFAWLSCEYGFRMIRGTHSGTKLCRPIHQLLAEIPVPIIDSKKMQTIHRTICSAHSLRQEAYVKESKAISIIENQVSAWQK